MDENMINTEMEEQEVNPAEEETSYGIGAIALMSVVAVGGIFLAVKGIQAGFAYARKHFAKKDEPTGPIEAEVINSTEDETEE